MLASPPRLKPPRKWNCKLKLPLMQAELAELAVANDVGGPGYYNGAEASGTARTARCLPPPKSTNYI